MLALSDLSEIDVQQAELTLVQLLKDEFPSMDLSRGRVLRELVVRPAALFHTLNEENMDRLRRSFSLQQISQDPALANDDIVNGVLSNLLLDRDDGSLAAGQLRIIISQSVTTPVDAGSRFTADGLEFVSTRAFVGVTSASNVVGTGSRLITDRGDGFFEFLIDVEASETGTAYNVAAGQRFTVVPSIPLLVDIQAANDFADGRPSEDNADLVNRVQNGISPQTMAGRTHIEALLRENYPQLTDLSTIGFGDPEMRRDAHNLFAVSTGGKVDLYARMAVAPEHLMLAVTAVMQDVSTRRLRITLDRDQAAGVYDALAVYREGTIPFQLEEEDEPSLVDTLEIVSRDWGINLTSSSGEFVPAIFTPSEAAFTRYRTLVVEFLDPVSILAAGESGSYQIYLLKMPDIASVQDFVNDRGRRGPATDYLVKAPVPAMCSIGVQITARVVGEVNADAVKAAITSRIHELGFDIGFLPGSVVIDAVQGQLPIDAVMDLPINMLARMYLPDGTQRTITGTDELKVPDVGDPSVSPRTVGWFLRTATIDVTVKELLTPRV